MTEVVWREWYNEAAVKQLTEMGTLSRYQIELSIEDWMDGCDVAAEIAKRANQSDFEAFQKDGKIVIIEPEYVAGTFDIEVEYEPSFSAWESDEE